MGGGTIATPPVGAKVETSLQQFRNTPPWAGQQSPVSPRVAHPGLLEHDASTASDTKILTGSLGVTVGDTVVISLDGKDGEELGILVRIDVPASLNRVVLDTVGMDVGLLVIKSLGIAVGSSVTMSLGELDGKPVGMDVGLIVIKSLGLSVGLLVTMSLGELDDKSLGVSVALVVLGLLVGIIISLLIVGLIVTLSLGINVAVAVVSSLGVMVVTTTASQHSKNVPLIVGQQSPSSSRAAHTG